MPATGAPIASCAPLETTSLALGHARQVRHPLLRAAVRALRKEEPVQIVVAVPVGARDSCEELSAEVDDLVCQLQAVGLWYQDFAPTSDDEVRELLAKGAHGLENRVG